jgi:hypothetical protein
VIDPNKHLETALERHVCVVDHSRHMVLNVMFQPKFLLCGLPQEGFQCFLMFLMIVLFSRALNTSSARPSIRQTGCA